MADEKKNNGAEKKAKRKAPVKTKPVKKTISQEVAEEKENNTRVLNPDKFMDLFHIFKNAKDIEELKPILYKHLLTIAQRHNLAEEYQILYLYEPNSSIKQAMVDRIYNAIPDDNNKPILLVLHNHGGRIEPAFLISKTCKELSPKFVVTIPRKAKSAATLIALGGNEIHMGPMSELGPIDPQFNGLPALGISSSLESIAKIVCKYSESSLMFAEYLKEKLDLNVLGYFERVSESAQQYATRLLADKKLPQEPEQIAHQFVYEYKDHSFVIDKEEAKELLGDTIKINTNEYKFSNDIHRFLTDVNLMLDIFHSKSLAIVGSARDFNLSSKNKNEDN